MRAHVPELEPFRWEGIDIDPYRPEGSHFRGITRQVLFRTESSELRYFEIEPDGYSSLERHDHPHSVVVLRGSGRCLVGGEIHELTTNDLVSVPPQTWHQFRADGGEALGFLCLVPSERDRPRVPDAAEVEALRRDSEIAAFVRT